MGRPVSTIRRLRLGLELRRMREQCGKSQIEAAEALDTSDTKVSRLEAGKTGLSRLELVALLDLYEVSDTRLRDGLIELNRNSKQRGWWQQHRDVLSTQLLELIELESTASSIFQYEALVMPGLLQTEAYARAMISGFPLPPSTSIDDTVRVRLERQLLLAKEDAPSLLCLLDEAVLRRQVGGPKVMAEQLRRLVELNDPPHLTIQVIPFARGAYPGLDGSFLRFLFSGAADMDIVFLEQKESRVFVEEAASVETYRIAAEHLRSQALSSPESMDLISAIAAEFDSM
ncbi:helix-turn-helix transcriptional regulator [Streptomyces sp. DSM 44915]|uniref:Helix-turn-helix transcriptional regulator n=1 Tax=Streptomyces chisholmiae TaxID=3075540 RepID=A0ABU2JPJ2_9ACTN|nr:helix-turn-helix transcriptional regulator [Streptomyces sp. DSM 44915]MDT0266900.1 helix-turn-helix transcriptional regulator [Streptomyces sp. DSM 44915]